MSRQRTPLQFIQFAAAQARDAERFGFTRNEACRNLKTALHQYWQHLTLRMHGQGKKLVIPRSRAAARLERGALIVEHVVPVQVIVDMILDARQLSLAQLQALLERFYIVRVVTRGEDQLLRSAGLRFKMPPGWNGRDPWARYRAAGIRLCDGYRHPISRRGAA